MFGIHLATAAEAMALGARAGLNVRNLFDIISTAAGNSWYYLLWTHLLAYQNGTNLFPLNLFNWAFKVTEEKLDEMQRRWCCKESVQWHKLGALWLHSNLEIILAVYWDYCWGTHFGNTLLPIFIFRAFSNRVPHMLDNDYSPKSALDLLAKDLVRISTRVPCDLSHWDLGLQRMEVKLDINTWAVTGYNTGRSQRVEISLAFGYRS
jgi:hypothetical protein